MSGRDRKFFFFSKITESTVASRKKFSNALTNPAYRVGCCAHWFTVIILKIYMNMLTLLRQPGNDRHWNQCHFKDYSWRSSIAIIITTHASLNNSSPFSLLFHAIFIDIVRYFIMYCRILCNLQSFVTFFAELPLTSEFTMSLAIGVFIDATSTDQNLCLKNRKIISFRVKSDL